MMGAKRLSFRQPFSEIPMLRKFLLGGLLAALSAAIPAQVPVEQLAKPAANATHYVIQSTGGKHGDSYIWKLPDGTSMGRETLVLRGQVFESDSTTKIGKDGMPAAITIRGFSPNGDVGETYGVAGGKATWKS